VTAPELRVVPGGKGGVPATTQERRTVDLPAEDAVLCNVLVDPAALPLVSETLRPEHFTGRGRWIYEAALAVAADGDPVTTVTVSSKLLASGRLQQVGGTSFLIELTVAAPALGPSHLRAHARVVLDLAVRRQLSALGDRVRAGAEVSDAPTEGLIGEARARLDELALELSSADRGARAPAVVAGMLSELRSSVESHGATLRATGFAALDRATAGMHDELLLVGARPGMGKTSFACAIACNVARAGGGVFVASLETDRKTLMLRTVCGQARVVVHSARAGALSFDELARFEAAARDVANLPIWIDDASGVTVRELWNRCRRTQLELAREGRRLALVVVDFVQLLRAPRAGMASREEAVAENVRALKAMAGELGVTVLGLAQLNRGVETRSDKRPALSDLRESGELEQCARTILLLYRQDYYARRKRAYQPTRTVEVNIAKQNNGPTQTVVLEFDERTLAFSDQAAHAPACRCPECDPDDEGGKALVPP
jgi:replicative DNA helicase